MQVMRGGEEENTGNESFLNKARDRILFGPDPNASSCSNLPILS